MSRRLRDSSACQFRASTRISRRAWRSAGGWRPNIGAKATPPRERRPCFGFETIGLDEIVSFTVPDNLRSRRVMERIGMAHDAADDFDHPVLPGGQRRLRHVLYRIEHPERPEV